MNVMNILLLELKCNQNIWGKLIKFETGNKYEDQTDVRHVQGTDFHTWGEDGIINY